MKPNRLLLLLALLFAGIAALSACSKDNDQQVSNPQATGATFDLSFHQINAGKQFTFTSAECASVQGYGVQSSGNTAINILANANDGSQLVLAIALQPCTGTGIYAMAPIASASGTCSRFTGETTFASDTFHNISVELTKYGAKGDRINGTINATVFHAINAQVADTEVVDVHGSFSVIRNY